MVLREKDTAQPLGVFHDDDCLIADDFVVELWNLCQKHPGIHGWGPVVEGRARQTQRLHRLAQLGAQRDSRRLLSRRCTVLPRRFWLLHGFSARCCCNSCRSCRSQKTLPGQAALDLWGTLWVNYALCTALTAHGHVLSFGQGLRAAHLNAAAGRAAAGERGAARASWFRQLARTHGRSNPCSLLHLGWACLTAATGAGQEPGHWRGILRGLLSRSSKQS